MKLDDITFKIRGGIFDVYNALGPGLLESAYEKALVYDLRNIRKMRVEEQLKVPIIYKGYVIEEENFRLDLLVENTVIVELKAVEELKPLYYMQLRTYLKLLGKPVGFLVNFNTDDILGDIHKVYNSTFASE